MKNTSATCEAVKSLESEPYLVLGLDIGIASCGWALLDTANKFVVGLGVHLWDVPQEDKTKQSKAVTRRSARSIRRSLERKHNRGKACVSTLQRHGLMPEGVGPEWLQTVKGELQPLGARVKALDEPLSDRELAQSFYNICRRRGYIPHGEGKAGKDGDLESKKVLNAIGANEALMAEKGYRTVGEMMLEEGKEKGKPCGISRNKAGDYSRCLTMELLLAEVDAIFEAQRSLGNTHATEELQSEFTGIMTWEKDTSDRDERIYNRVGRCVHLPLEKRGAKACLSFERCCAFERVSNIRIVMPDGTNCSLPTEARRWCMDILFSPVPIKGNKDCKVTYKALRKHLDMDESYFFKGVEFNKEAKEEVIVPKVWRLERETLPEALLRRMLDDSELADGIGSALAYAGSIGTLLDKLTELDLTEAEIDALCELPWSNRAFSGYGNRSVTAMQMICDAFEDYENVASLDEALDASGLKYASGPSNKGQCLPPYLDYDPTCTNPVVMRAMARVRKVVNAIIAEYGMPHEVHAELGRDLKRSKKEQLKIAKANNEAKEKREAAKKKLAEDLHCTPEQVSGSLLRKYLLHIEQGGLDIYTGKPISYKRLIDEPEYCDIDHILPYSRTCDDSQMNKVLVTAASNREKGARSPYEWLGETEGWGQFAARITAMKKAGYPSRKADRLLERNLAKRQGEFIKRNLNDTRYISVAAKNYIETYLEFSDNGKRQHVVCVAGGATSALRSAWGFAGKDREANDCHHAVDAAIVAACTQGTVKKVAEASEKKMLTPKAKRASLFKATEPWEGFAGQVEESAAAVVPTRRVEHGWTGRLFEDTLYHFEGMNDKGTKAILRAKGKEKPSGNYVFRDDGAAMLPDGQAFLRLWRDAEKTTFLREIVYYADLPQASLENIKKGAYVPRYVVSNKIRPEWPEVPQRVLDSTEPIVLHYGDAVRVADEVLRYKTCDAATGALSWGSIYKFKSDKNRPVGQKKPPAVPSTIPTKLKDPSLLEVVNEDILGLCYKSGRYQNIKVI